jgi:hypothetical protein
VGVNNEIVPSCLTDEATPPPHEKSKLSRVVLLSALSSVGCVT